MFMRLVIFGILVHLLCFSEVFEFKFVFDGEEVLSDDFLGVFKCLKINPPVFSFSATG